MRSFVLPSILALATYACTDDKGGDDPASESPAVEEETTVANQASTTSSAATAPATTPEVTESPVFKSCLEILNGSASTGDGNYSIDPDGAGGDEEFEVYCDMTTAGGGWTRITLELAATKLSGTSVAEEEADVAGIDGSHRPFTQHIGAHTYHYTFDFPGSFQSFYLSDYKAKANAFTGNTSDIGFDQSLWTVANEPSRGDISFGDAAQAGPETSFGATGPDGSYFDTELSFPSNGIVFDLSSSATQFRIGWGELGSENEGWYPWWDGYIFLR